MSKLFYCVVCNKEEVISLKDQHHVIPRHLGGTDDEENKVDLCSRRHQEIHRIASLPSEEQAQTHAKSVFKDKFFTAWYFIKKIHLAEQSCQHTKEFVEVKVSLPLSHYNTLKDLLHSYCNGKGKSATVPDLIKNWVDMYIKQQRSP